MKKMGKLQEAVQLSARLHCTHPNLNDRGKWQKCRFQGCVSDVAKTVLELCKCQGLHTWKKTCL